jgi:hypothetical protein
MTKPGPSPEYRDLLKGKITPDEYVKKIKTDVDRRLEQGQRRSLKSGDRRSAAA